ncbi:hypothetical protein GOP47_0017283 [Adiantum capillus-veneris]|uniref:LysM domain-containing protein n=1 Tax=Adiantum capillus-veneris TaxID=13818 RepID=A0A9D4UF54_ADICA|nr:hypothetical protein GOP47_0017283 [Adiantum capillus-veneris]
MAPPGESKDGFVAKAAGVAVVSGIAWSILKSFTTSATPSPPPIDTSAHKQTYHVSQGDTLFSISQRFGVPIDDLKAANRVHGDDIFAGDQLVIPK